MKISLEEAKKKAWLVREPEKEETEMTTREEKHHDIAYYIVEIGVAHIHKLGSGRVSREPNRKFNTQKEAVKAAAAARKFLREEYR